MTMIKAGWRRGRLLFDAVSRRVHERPLMMDGLIAVVVAALFCVWSTYVVIDATRPPDNLSFWVAALLTLSIAGQPIALVFRRSSPLFSFLAVSVMSLVQAAFPRAPQTLPSLTIFLFALYAYCAYGKRSAAMIGLVIGALGAAAVTGQLVRNGQTTNGHVLAVELFGTFLGVVLAAWSLGLVRRAQIVHVSTLEERAARAEAEREERARRAVLEERARIAREMHDVIAHSLAVIVSQAQGGQYAARSDPSRATEVLETIAQAGREALSDMRGLLDVLRPDTPAPTTDSRLPQPGLQDLPELLDRVRHAGLSVEYSEQGPPLTLGSSAELAIYRLVQEALTNSLKHAGPGTRANVRLEWTEDELSLSVTDNGRAPVRNDGRGQGLIGMRERVAMLGGSVVAGSAPAGGFVVQARIPRRSMVAGATL